MPRPAATTLACLAVGGLVAFAATVPTAAAASNASTTCSGPDSFPFEPDFNGDGHTDFVVGMPGAEHGTGGIEVVLHGHTPVVYRPGTHGIPAMPAGSRFGSTTAATNLNSDGCADLLVGVPDLTVGGVAQAGGVQVLFGTPTGFTAGPLITQGVTGAPGEPTADGHFGTSVASESADPDGTEITVGVPGATVMGGSDGTTPLPQAGEVVDFDLSSSGAVELANADYQVQTMATGPEPGAHYGTIANLDLATAPDANDGAKADTGYLEIDRTGFFGRDAGDRLGASLTQGPAMVAADDLIGLFAGAPGHRVGGHDKAGAVEWFDWDPDGGGPSYVGTFTQATPGVTGKPETGARFGASVAEAYPRSPFDDDVVVGAPGHSAGSVPGAGAIYSGLFVQGGKDNGYVSHSWSSLTQASPGVPGVPRRHAGFGYSLACFVANYADSAPRSLLIGIPRAHAAGSPAAGAVVLMPMGKTQPLASHVQLIRRVEGQHAGDDFGAWLEGHFAE